MAYGVLGVGAIGAAIVTGLCENVADAPRMLLSPRNAEMRPASRNAFPPSMSRRTTRR
jgi:pyrroline-5-carboxylate reductase